MDITKYVEFTDLELIERIREKDVRAFEELYDRYSSILYTLVKKIAPDLKTAEIILIEVFAIVWNKAHRFDFDSGNVYAWLIYLARNRTVDSLKRSRPASEDLDNYDDPYENYFIVPHLDQEIDSLDLSTAMNIKPKMEEALEKLTDAQKYVLHMSFYEGFTLNEISEKLNVPIETVREKVMTAIHNLRDNLIGE